jgi:hypothetical protein
MVCLFDFLKRILNIMTEFYGDYNHLDAHVLYEEDCSWEFSFITQELLTGFPVSMFSHKNIDKVSPPISPKNTVLVFTSNLHSFNEIDSVCRRIRPTIIIHCSDEWGNKPEFDELANNCRLYLRQHRHAHYPKRDIVKVMPLGYGVGMFKGKWSDTIIKPSHLRKQAWSFVGNIKSDRDEMIKAFAQLGDGFYGNAEKDDMRDIYLDSKFVPVGRGNVSLNCLRVYEALSAGSIPVIVGGREEIDNTFSDEDTAGWVFATSWSEAVERCKKMIENAHVIDAIQQIVLDGWKTRLACLRRKIISKMHHNF